MARHRKNSDRPRPSPSRPSIALAEFHALAVFTIGRLIATTRTFFRFSGDFHCEHCEVEMAVDHARLRELRTARRLATDHSLHGPAVPTTTLAAQLFLA